MISYYEISESLDNRYKKLSRKQKAWIVVGAILLLLMSLCCLGGWLYSNYQRRLAVSNYEKLLEKSKQNYYLQTVANNNLEKKLQDMSLRLAELKNNTIELERMFSELSSEKVSLEEIRQQMEIGLRNSRAQLDKMQRSVNVLIDQRTKTVIKTEEEIIYEKSDTHGK